MKRYLPLLLLLALLSCTSEPAPPQNLPTDWPALEASARGKTVDWMMWSGDPLINDYVQNFVAPAVRQRYGITLNVVPGQGTVIVQTLLKELEAGRETSAIDLCWINGETFYQLRQIDGLYGPWTERLPNARYIDFANPFIGTDFQQPIAGYELPWGNVQMTVIYDSAKVATPPCTRAELLAFVKANPGRFTWPTEFTGLTFLKALLIDIAGGGQALAGDFDETGYARYSKELWTYVNQLKPYLWREGRTFPETLAALHQMFANGELWFTMSNNDVEVDNKIGEGLFPATARAYVPDFGSIQNSHYLGITKLSDDKAAAMVVANFLISPEAQLRKADPAVWGDGTVYAVDRLPDSLRTAFQNLPGRVHAPQRAAIQANALQELAPEYMIRLAEDFRTQVINR
ncbi:ABC transporter substrate-binding protein [Neolewinella sp.]|uniref:ABC transporter substrate-binding protein n=1 Tax=Neolewinella sp. TaxID=2993543 RepID=UPI003B517253